MTRSRAVYIAVSAVLSVLLVSFLLSQVKAEDIAQTLKQVYIPGLLLYAVVHLASSWLKAWRYKRLLRPQPISWPNMLLVTFIRGSLEDLLPARIGSLSYIYVLNKRLGFSFETAASSFVVAFVLDFLTLSPFLVLAFAFAGFGLSGISTAAWLVLAVVYFVLMLLVLWKIVPVGRFLVSAYAAVLRALRLDRREKIRLSVAKLSSTVDCLGSVRSPKTIFPLFFVSLLIRLCKYVSLFVLLHALLRSHGLGSGDLSFWKTILGLTGAEMTSALPVKGIADFGTWESAWVLVFQWMGFDARLALLSGIGIHLVTNLWEYTLGFLSLLILIVPYLAKSRRERR